MKLIICMIFLVQSVGAFEIKLLYKDEPNFWKRTKFENGTIVSRKGGSTENGKFKIVIKNNTDNLIISDGSKGLLFSGKDLVVADIKQDGKWVLLYLEKERKPGRDFFGLLLCCFTAEGVMSKGVMFPGEGRDVSPGKIAYLDGIYSFNYPIVKAQFAVYRRGDATKEVTRYRGRITMNPEKMGSGDKSYK